MSSSPRPHYRLEKTDTVLQTNPFTLVPMEPIICTIIFRIKDENKQYPPSEEYGALLENLGDLELSGFCLPSLSECNNPVLSRISRVSS